MAIKSLSIDTFINRNAFSKIVEIFKIGKNDFTELIWGKKFLWVLLVIAGAGVVSGIIALALGHHVQNTSDTFPWGILISTYVFFVVSSTGLCLVSSLGHVFGFKQFDQIAKKAILFALITLLVGFAVIATELSYPLKLVIYAVVSPNFRAPILWMGLLYGVYMVLISIELFFLILNDHKKSKIAGLLSIIAAITAHSNLGAVFGLNYARDYWYGPFLPIYFIVSALLCGASIIIMIVYFTDYFGNNKTIKAESKSFLQTLSKLLALFLGIIMFFTIWKFISAIYLGHPHKFDVIMQFISGKLSVTFWTFEVFLGMVIPFGILLSKFGKEPKWIAVSALLPMVSIFFMRFNFVYAGQMYSLKSAVNDSGLEISAKPFIKVSPDMFLNYSPSPVELMIAVGAVAGAVIVYIAATKFIKIEN